MRFIFVLLFAICTQVLHAQVVTGLYSGTLVNDSTKKEQRYELALSEYRGKITGYSYTTFVRNDSLFYSVKRVKATKKDNQLVVEDEKMLNNNFPESPAKRVHQTNNIQLTNEDTLRTVTGTWQTNRTKIYYALTGGVAMKLDNDSTHSALIGHLKELNIIFQPRYQAGETKIKANNKIQPSAETTAAVASQNTKPVVSGKEQKSKPDDGKSKEMVKTDKQSTLPADEPGFTNAVVKSRTETVKTTTNAIKPVVNVLTKLPVAPAYTERKKNKLQAIEIASDSIQLSLYDNGVIDGDSISVYMNGETVFANTKLTATATKKTVSLPATETIEIILVAENLGSIPPNTGLLVIKDGEQTYQVHFTADLKTNAAIIFKKKLK